MNPPIYKQTLDFTCGPACLLMAMGHFNKEIKLTKDAEIAIWRESNLVELYGTCRYGLALSAWARGFSARILSNSEGILYESVIEECNIGVNRAMLDFFFDHMRKRCMAAGIREEFGDVSVEAIEASLKKGEVPIVLTDAALFGDERAPHWVIVFGVEEEKLSIINPFSGTKEIVEKVKFKTGLGYKGKACMIAI